MFFGFVAPPATSLALQVPFWNFSMKAMNDMEVDGENVQHIADKLAKKYVRQMGGGKSK